MNRILMPYLMEAVRLHESGIAAEVIDEAMLEFGMPMGPLELSWGRALNAKDGDDKQAFQFQIGTGF